MSEQVISAADRGAQAYKQAYELIAAGGMYRTRRGKRRAAMTYLLVTASPPLTPAQVAAAEAAMRQMRGGGL